MSIFNLSEFTVRRHANPKSFQRGEAYYDAGAVVNITQRGNWLQAEVEGNEAKAYDVSLCGNQEGLTVANCTCEYGYEGWCKHIVATTLFCLRQPQAIEQRPSLTELLNRLDLLQTQKLIQELVTEHPKLLDEIDQYVSWISQPSHHTRTIKSEITVDVAPVRRQVRDILWQGVRGLEAGDEDNPITEELENLIQIALDYNEQGEGKNAIAILTAITGTCAENWQDLAEYGFDNDNIVYELNQAWSEAILSHPLTLEAAVDLQVELETWQDEWDADFGMALAALRQGWDDPQLLQVLSGNTTEREVTIGDNPEYEHELICIRLQILEWQQRYEEYLNLAYATGYIKKYLEMLGRLGRVEAALAAAQAEMTSSEEALTLAQTLYQQGALSEALSIAQAGFNLPGNCHYSLGIWTSDIAAELGDHAASLLGLKTAFQAQPGLSNYQEIAKLAGENWHSIKAELLEIVRNYRGWGREAAKVEIFLAEGMIDDAIAIVQDLHSYHDQLIHRVMAAAVSSHPEWVITNACRRAEAIIDAGKAEHYDQAINWLQQLRTAYLASGRNTDWANYRQKLIADHRCKRKLMAMLKDTNME
jgi:uncharacterized Zn finger protein